MQKTDSNKELIDYLTKLIGFKKLILLNFFIFLLITYIITLFLPKWYKAETVLLPPAKDLSIGLSALVSNLPIAPTTLGMADEETNKYIAILESKNLRSQIIKKRNLMTVYNATYLEEALNELSKNTKIIVGNENTINIEVWDKSPERASEIANSYAFYLDSLYTKYSTQKAHFNRVFFENQLQETQDSLNLSENLMKQFQSTYGAISLPEQIEATIKASGDLIAQKFAVQIELKLKEQVLEPTHSEIITLKQTIRAIDEKLETMQQSDQAIEAVFLPFNNLPNLGLQYAKLFRNIEIHNKLFAIIYQQYQQAKIEEAKDTPSVQILDKATPPYKRSKPKRVLTAIINAVSTTLILIIGLLGYIHLDFLKQSNPSRYHKVNLLIKNIFSLKEKSS